jgi:DNA polymerase-1
MNITTLTQPGSLSEWLKTTAPDIALDLEWTVDGGSPRRDQIISGAVTGRDENEVAFFGPELLPELLTAKPDTTFYMHYASSDLKHLAWAGVELHHRYRCRDTLILCHLLDENGDHGLGDLVKRYYGDDYKAEFWAKYKKAEDAPEAELREYNAKDVHYTLMLSRLLRDGLRADGIPTSLVDHVHSLQSSLLATEIAGVAVDKDYLLAKGVELKTKIEKLRPEMRTIVQAEIEGIECDLWCKEIDKRKTDAGRARVQKPEFSFDSPKQLTTLLYDKLALEKQYNEKTKNLTCDWDALEKLQDEHPVIPLLMQYREAQKVYGTYIEGTLERMHDGRVFPSFNCSGTATGRISHSDPNLGNLPRSGGIRGIFIPDPGHVFISADFSQLEVCLSAHFTRDPNLLRIVNEGASQHDITAASLGIERQLAKTLNFAAQYSCSAYKMAKILGVPPAKGKEVYEKYWSTYAGQRALIDECAAKVDTGEPIVSPFGRRRRFEVRRRQPWDGAYRQAFNALVQGTGSDLTSRAFYLTDQRLRSAGIGRGLFTVHDEVIVQAQKGHEAEAEKILVDTMCEVGVELGLSVELKAQGSGPMSRWCD